MQECSLKQYMIFSISRHFFTNVTLTFIQSQPKKKKKIQDSTRNASNRKEKNGGMLKVYGVEVWKEK